MKFHPKHQTTSKEKKTTQKRAKKTRNLLQNNIKKPQRKNKHNQNQAPKDANTSFFWSSPEKKDTKTYQKGPKHTKQQRKHWTPPKKNTPKKTLTKTTQPKKNHAAAAGLHGQGSHSASQRARGCGGGAHEAAFGVLFGFFLCVFLLEKRFFFFFFFLISMFCVFFLQLSKFLFDWWWLYLFKNCFGCFLMCLFWVLSRVFSVFFFSQALLGHLWIDVAMIGHLMIILISLSRLRFGKT